jgi:uncharacterized protein (TIGR00730 family)
MQQTFTRVWLGGFMPGGQSSLRAVDRICVFCGSSPGGRPAYREATVELARLLVSEGIGVVYGGGRVGLMGALADAVLAEGGEITGVIPRSLVNREIGHCSVADMHIVGSMHERKATMADLSDAFVALPGGIGTLEELFEVYTWAQLGFHSKPVALLDVGGYYAPLLEMLEHMVARGFLDHASRALLDSDTRIDALLDRLMDRLATRRG